MQIKMVMSSLYIQNLSEKKNPQVITSAGKKTEIENRDGIG